MHLEIDISRRIGSDAAPFTLEIALDLRADRIVLFGPSGSGKTLTLKVIAGLLRPDRGLVRVNGRTLFDSSSRIDLPPRDRDVGYLFQEYALFPHLTVRQNIAFSLTRGWMNPRRADHHASVDHWLAIFKLSALAGRYPHELSGGQQQRTALARALVRQPGVLLLDEPFSAIEPALRAELRHELDALQRRIGVPMVVISHDPEDAAFFGDVVVRVQAGRIAGTTVQVNDDVRHGRCADQGNTCFVNATATI